MESAKVRVEVWPVVADEAGLWLISGEAPWTSGNVPYDLGPHEEVRLLIEDHEVEDRLKLFHSTSWRSGAGHVTLSYVAALEASSAQERWPDAWRVTPQLSTIFGRPKPTPPVGRPEPRPVDVLLHGLRHFRFLTLTDHSIRRALGGRWGRHLQDFSPALAGMYHHPDEPLAIDLELLESWR